MNNLVWFGEIPKHWLVKKGKYLYKFIETGKRDSGENNSDGKYPFFTCSKEILNIDDYSFDREALLVAGNGIVGETKYYKGKFDAYQRVYVISDFTAEIHVPYLRLYMTNNFMIYLNWRMIGSVINFVKLEDIKNFDISYPNYKNQIKISNYLNVKAIKIDQLIYNQQQQIEKLKEYKQSLVSSYFDKYVFDLQEQKGLINKTAKPINQITNIVRGNSAFKKDELLTEGNYIGLQYGKTYKTEVVDNSYNYYVDGKFYKEDQVVNKGDVILISTSETVEDLGHVCFYNREDTGLLGGEQFVLKPNKDIINGKFLYYCTVEFSKYIKKYCTGLKVYRFNSTHLKNIYIDLPNIKEQSYIVQILDKKIYEINTLLEIKQMKIDKLVEYKKSLIYEYVTGKKEIF
jgi:type I restriction enzyme S subunit